jgi:hypothetical protein
MVMRPVLRPSSPVTGTILLLAPFALLAVMVVGGAVALVLREARP